MEFSLPCEILQKSVRRFCAVFFAATVFFMIPETLCAETPGSAMHSIFSLDLGYLGTGLKNNGWGLGFSYETEVMRYLAFKGGLSHMTLNPTDLNRIVITVGAQLEAHFYPFGRGLDWLYLGAGSGTDFIIYKNDSGPGGRQRDFLATVIGKVGWKQNFFGYVMADMFVGYKFPINKATIDFSNAITRHGLEYGIKLRLNLPVIAKRIFKRRVKAKSEPAEPLPPEDGSPQLGSD